jgi:hypothetical protein
MTTNPTTPGGSAIAFRKLLGAGLLIWLIAALALIGVGRWATGQNGLISLVDWAVGQAWIAFLVGLVGILALSKWIPGALGRTLVAYLFPAAVTAVIGGICYAVFPDIGFLTEMLGFLILVWLFGVFGWLWLWSTPKARDQEGVLRALLPPLIGGIAVLVGVAVPTFQSNVFRYRNAFNLTLDKTVFADGKLTTDAVVEVRKPGNYIFRVVRYSYMDMIDDPDSQADHSTGRIEWKGTGAPAAAVTGSYPLTVSWDKAPAPAPLSDREYLEDYISLEVHATGDPETVIHSVSVPINGK